jgi:hypothetical protein
MPSLACAALCATLAAVALGAGGPEDVTDLSMPGAVGHEAEVLGLSLEGTSDLLAGYGSFMVQVDWVKPPTVHSRRRRSLVGTFMDAPRSKKEKGGSQMLMRLGDTNGTNVTNVTNATKLPPRLPRRKFLREKVTLRSYAASTCGMAPIRTEIVKRNRWTFIGNAADNGMKTPTCFTQHKVLGKTNHKIGPRGCKNVFARRNKSGAVVIAFSQLCRHKCPRHPRKPTVPYLRRTVGQPGQCISKCGKAPSFMQPTVPWGKSIFKNVFRAIGCARPEKVRKGKKRV